MRILSIDGGGFLGLGSASFLAELEDHFAAKCSDQFDVFTGTSTGAIIALALANGLTAREVVHHYESLGRDVFPQEGRIRRWLRRWPRGLFFSQYSAAPLQRALSDVLGDTTLGALRDRGKKVVVTAYNVSTGRPTVFKTDHSPRLTDHDQYRLVDVARASAAAPWYFPMVTLQHPKSGLREHFCDGGVFANSPALLAYAEAIGELGCSPRDIDILSISTPRQSIAEDGPEHSPRPNRGLLSWARPLTTVMIDGPSAASDGALKRLVQGLRADGLGYSRIELSATDGLALDLASPAAADSLLRIGATRGRSGELRAELRRFFVP